MNAERTATGFGQMLRDARERRGMTLRQIATATKISIAVLEALERNDISKLPGGIFGRAFVRSYAIEVGLDPETTIQRFIAQFPNDSVVAGHPVSGHVEDHLAVESERQTAGTFLWLIVIAVPVAAGLLYFATLGRRAATEAAPAPANAAPRPPAAPDAAPPQPPVEPAAVIPATVPATAAVTAADAARVATAPDADALTIAVTATRPCWVSATVDGRKTIERLLQAGEQQAIAVRREMVLTAGDAAAIAVKFNGADGRPLGKSGEVVTARFTPANYRNYLQAR
jgi:cytoskeleton protein RodZ